MRIGIDVGGTHTDAVLLEGEKVRGAVKALTSADVLGGITAALDELLAQVGIADAAIEAVMIGTTQFTNAVVERRHLEPVAAVRIASPAGGGLPPMLDWPTDIAAAVGRQSWQLAGGYLYDGRPLAAGNEREVAELIAGLKAEDVRAVAIASAFSPMNAEPETVLAARLQDALPGIRVTLSHEFGRLGLLERENAAILNAALLPFASRVVESFEAALANRGLSCPMFISQNDGTLMSTDFVRRFPALTFASGPTNSLRGASRLTGLDNAIVVDIGGTTTDIGVLLDGFPRESGAVVDIGGVRTNFRMPDITAMGLGGGSVVSQDGAKVGPQSVGHRLVEEGLVFGGERLTATDLVVAAGLADVGDPATVSGLDPAVVDRGMATIRQMLDSQIDRMKTSAEPVPVILVGGGSILVSGELAAASRLYRPEHADVANAIGAAIAQVGGEAERLVSFRDTSRDAAIAELTREATARAVAAGADPASVRRAEVDETPVPYMHDAASRIRIKVIGDVAAGGLGRSRS